MKYQRIQLSSISLLTILTLITACQPQNNLIITPSIINNKKSGNTQIKGNAEFPALTPFHFQSDRQENGLIERKKEQFSTKANLTDVSTQATVSIIYPPDHPTLANKTVATGLTDNSGNFIINPAPSFAPAPNDIFVLEAVKRIGRVGHSTLGISTYIRWNGTGWDSITSPGILINTKTTALTIIAGRNGATISSADTINTILSGVPQAIGAITAQTVLDVADLVNTVLTNNYDPVLYIGFQNGNYQIINPEPISTPTPVPSSSPTAPPITIGKFQVSGTNPNGSYGPNIGMDSAGNFIIAWNGWDDDGNGFGISVKRYDSNANLQGTRLTANTYTTGHQDWPGLGVSSTGKFVVTWRSTNGQTYANNYGQRFNADGSRAGNEFNISPDNASSNDSARTAVAADGSFVTVWRDYNFSNVNGGNRNDIYAKKYNSDGTVAVNKFRVNTTLPNDQYEPDIAMDSTGDFVITWTSGGQYDVYAQRYNSAAQPQGGEFRVNDYVNGQQGSPSIAMDAAGGFMIAWSGPGPEDDSGVIAKKYNKDGSLVMSEFKVNNNLDYDQQNPSVAMDPTGDFVISWNEFQRIPSGTDYYGNPYYDYNNYVYTKRYQANGTEGSEINFEEGNNQVYSSKVAMDNSGNFVVVVSSNNQIYAKKYNSNGFEL
jgi:hypothetical protein